MSTPINKKKKFVKDGVFYAELNEFLSRELREDGYTGVVVSGPANRTVIVIKATKTQDVIGERGKRILELTSLIRQRFGITQKDALQIYADKVRNKGLSAVAQAESLCYKLKEGVAARRACYGVLRFIMENEAKGCEIILSGKLRAQRAKAMKFNDGYMISSGDAANHYIDTAVRHIKLKQGVLGIRVKIMLPYDETGKNGCSVVQPDVIKVHEPKEEINLGSLQKQQGRSVNTSTGPAKAVEQSAPMAEGQVAAQMPLA